jgi:hypothetical protein
MVEHLIVELLGQKVLRKQARHNLKWIGGSTAE